MLELKLQNPEKKTEEEIFLTFQIWQWILGWHQKHKQQETKDG